MKRLVPCALSKQDIGLIIEALASMSTEGRDARYIAQMTHAWVELDNSFDRNPVVTPEQLKNLRDQLCADGKIDVDEMRKAEGQ